MGANRKKHPQYEEIKAAIRILYPEGGSAPITKLYKIPRTHVVRMAWQMGVKMTPEAKAKQALINSRAGGFAMQKKQREKRMRSKPAAEFYRDEADPLEMIALGIRR